MNLSPYAADNCGCCPPLFIKDNSRDTVYFSVNVPVVAGCCVLQLQNEDNSLLQGRGGRVVETVGASPAAGGTDGASPVEQIPFLSSGFSDSDMPSLPDGHHSTVKFLIKKNLLL